MTREGFYIDESSLRSLRINIRAFKGRVLESSVDGLKAFGMRIVAQAQSNLKSGGSLASGILRNSGRTVVQPDNTVDAGFYARYAEFVEYGRRSGKMPPVDSLYQWIRRKGKSSNSALKAAAVFTGKSTDVLARSAAWAIAKSIARKGTRPHPFLKPAYEQYRGKIGQFMQNQINKAVNEFRPPKIAR